MTWMKLEDIMLSEISQAEKDNYIFHSYVELKKNKTEDHRRREGRKKRQNQRGRQTVRDK